MIEGIEHLADWVPTEEADRRAVLAQLDQLLESPLFRNSKRYPNLLRYVVEQALEGNEALLKERLLGVAVFHRTPDYDTNQDTVVRLTAGEVRKRIAQYYHQPEHAGELQIDLRPGSYVPVFRRSDVAMPEAGESDRGIARSRGDGAGMPIDGASAEKTESGHWDEGEPAVADPVPGQTAALAKDPAGTKQETGGRKGRLVRGTLLRWMAAGFAAIAVAGAIGSWWWSDRAGRAADQQLWAPILEEPGQVQLVLSDLSAQIQPPQGERRPEGVSLYDLLRMGELVNYRDSLALTDVVAFLATQRKPYRLELSTQARYPDLQQSASILVGGLDNLWTMRVTEPLRYHFVRRGADYVYTIEDRQHPDQPGWHVDLAETPANGSEDYAIVARIFDVTTGRPVLVLAGIGANGTAAAAQFLLDPERIGELTPHAPRDWQHRNMEAVIRMQILDNRAGPPHLVACHFW
jgi:hypothetical protein